MYGNFPWYQLHLNIILSMIVLAVTDITDADSNSNYFTMSIEEQVFEIILLNPMFLFRIKMT